MKWFKNISMMDLMIVFFAYWLGIIGAMAGIITSDVILFVGGMVIAGAELVIFKMAYKVYIKDRDNMINLEQYHE